MTTFDDTDFFTDAFTGFGSDENPRRRSSMLTGLVLVAAAALVAGGMIWVKLAQQPAAAAFVDPITTLSVFDPRSGPRTSWPTTTSPGSSSSPAAPG